MRSRLQALLECEDPLLLDGGMGSAMFVAGLETGAPPEVWNLTHPEAIRTIHRDYITAGSRVVLTNSFGGTRNRLALGGLDDRISEINEIAARLARAETDSAPGTVVVGGSMGPTGELLEPYGTLTPAAAVAAFAEQATALVAGGVDMIWIETMSDLGEVAAAVEGVRSVCALEIAVTMSFETRGHTMMGVHPTDAAKALRDLDLVAIGTNCGIGSPEAAEAIAAMRAVDPEVSLIAKSNAGLPYVSNGEIIYPESPDEMAEHALRLREMGADLIGGCCGSTYEHIRAMAEVLGVAPSAV